MKTQKHQTSPMDFMTSQNRSPLYVQALEPRILYDAAGLVSGAEIADSLDTADDAGAHQSTDSDSDSGTPPRGAPNHLDDTELLDAFKGLDSLPGDDPREIVFVDAAIDDYQTLIDGVGDDAEVVRIDSGAAGVSVISRVLAERSNLSAVHIVTHGDPGVLYLGTTRLSSDSLPAFENSLRGWGDALTQDADILFYGCDVADGTEGKAFVDRLSDLTGADVAASVDDTGSAALGGDWDLEQQTGAIETNIAFNSQSRAAFSSLLAVADEDFNDDAVTTNGDGSLTNDGFIYESDTSGAVEIDNTVSGSLAIGSGNYLVFNKDFNTDNGGDYFEIRASDSGDDFEIDSLGIQVASGAADSFNIEGFNGGDLVKSETINLDGAAGIFGSITYSKPNGLVDAGTLTFNSDWTGIDRIRFTDTESLSISAFIDDINITPEPTVTSATYNATTGALVVTATDLQANGSDDDIDVSDLTLTGEGGATYTLTDSADVERASATEFTVTLSDTDKAGVNQILNKSGLKSTDDTTYNLAAAEDWNRGAFADVDIEDLTLNGITVSGLGNATPTIQTNTGLTVDEGDSGTTISSTILAATDVDDTDSSLIYTITGLTSNGSLARNGVTLSVNSTFTQGDIDSGLITYTHDGGETTSDSFTFTVKDDDGATTAAQTFAITVSSVNDAPTIVTNSGLTVDEGGSGSLPDTALVPTDVDDANSTLIYTVTGLTANGTLTRNGVTLSVNGTFTQADIESGLVTYTHDGSETTSDSFTFTVQDADGASTAAQTFNITVNPVNDPPTIVTNSGLTLDEGASSTLAGSNLAATDVDDADSSLIYTLTGLPANGSLAKNGATLSVNDTFTQGDIDSGLITYTHDDSETTSDSFTYTVQDDDGASTAAQTFNITVNPVNDPPTIVTNSGLTLDEGASSTLAGSNLAATDVDDADSSLIYTLTGLPANGSLAKNGATLSVNDTFTQGDIDSGLITYTHDDSETTADSFTYTVQDDDGATTAAQTFSITVTPVADDPVVPITTTTTPDPPPSDTNTDTGSTSGTTLITSSSAEAATTGSLIGDSDGTDSNSTGSTFDTTYDDPETYTEVDLSVDAGVDDQNLKTNEPFSFAIPANTFTRSDFGRGLQLTATLADGSLLPTWVSFDSTTGTFTGVVPELSTDIVLNVVVTAQDESGKQTSATFQIHITVSEEQAGLLPPSQPVIDLAGADIPQPETKDMLVEPPSGQSPADNTEPEGDAIEIEIHALAALLAVGMPAIPAAAGSDPRRTGFYGQIEHAAHGFETERMALLESIA